MLKTEDFMAAVDFLSVREDVDPDKIGIIEGYYCNDMRVKTSS